MLYTTVLIAHVQETVVALAALSHLLHHLEPLQGNLS
jgi:hypothetical protein